MTAVTRPAATGGNDGASIAAPEERHALAACHSPGFSFRRTPAQAGAQADEHTG